jgi:hypothetical protein
MFERIQSELVRATAQNTKSENKYKGVLNDIYMDARVVLPEDVLRKTSYVTTVADYSTGTATVAAAGTSITGASTAWASANSNDGLFKADDEETVYRVTYNSATQLDLSSPSAWADDAVSAGDYRLLFDRLALATDFSHMPQDNKDDPEIVYWWNNAGKAFLEPEDNGEYDNGAAFSYSTPGFYTVKWVDSDPYLYIRPCDDSSRVLFYDYIPELQPMMEFTAGTVTITKDATAVTGASTLFGDFIDTTANDYYLRVDADGTGVASEWYKIASVTDDTNLVLSTAHLRGAAATSAYTISMVPKWPAKYDRAIMYAAAARIDPNNKDVEKWSGVVEGLIPGWNKVFGTRIVGRKGPFNLSKYK